MRILITAHDYVPRLGGLANCIFELATALGEIPGVEVRVLAPRAAGSEAFDQGKRFLTIRVRLPERASRATLPLAFAIRRTAREWEPDLILDSIWSPCSAATRIATLLSPGAKWKQAILVHGVEVLESKRNLRKRLRFHLAFWKKYLFRHADCAFPVSEFTRRLVLLHCDIPDARVHPFFNGVNAEAFSPATSKFNKSKLGIDPAAKVLFTLARLEPYKGVDYTLEALALLKDRPIHLLLGGSGPDESRLRRMAKELGIQRKVTFLGKVPQEDLHEYYNFCDAFVLLSRIDWHAPEVEGFGLVYLEAAACGKPSLGPAVGGPVDAVEDGITGLLVDPTDVTEIAAALEKLLFQAGFAEALGAEALKRVRARFLWKDAARKLLEGAKACAE
jgi:phosphatidyl-myo-inositol dimannoside synthase